MKTLKPKALDIGCKKGEYARHLQKLGYRVKGFDINLETNLKEKDFHIYRGDMSALDTLTAESFSYISAHNSLHYFDKKTTQNIFNRIYDLLKKDGTFDLIVKSNKDIFSKVASKQGIRLNKPEQYWDWFFKKERKNRFFTKEELEEELSKAGLKIKATYPIQKPCHKLLEKLNSYFSYNFKNEEQHFLSVIAVRE